LEACTSDDPAAVSPPPALRTTLTDGLQSVSPTAPPLRQSEITLENNKPTARLKASVY
jgi:hypothetical protein